MQNNASNTYLAGFHLLMIDEVGALIVTHLEVDRRWVHMYLKKTLHQNKVNNTQNIHDHLASYLLDHLLRHLVLVHFGEYNNTGI